MPDLSTLSTDELLALHKQALSQPAAPKESVDLSGIPTDELLKMHKAAMTPVPAKPEGIDVKGLANSAMRGAAQGATLGFADEATAGVGGLYDYIQAKLGNRGDISLSDAYHTRRDAIRRADAASEAEHPWAYTGGQVGGALATAFVPGASALNVGKGASLGEAVGKGALMGGVAGAGNAKEITDVPSEATRGAVTGGAVGGALWGAGKGLSAIGRRVGPMTAKVVGGVDEKTLGKYLEAPDRINAIGALPEDAVKDAVDAGVSRVVGDKEALASRAGDLEDALNTAYAQKQAELAGSATPLAKAKEMSAALQGEKAALGTMSQQADEVLAKSGVTFKKTDLLKAIDTIGKGAGDAIGDEAANALQKLQTTRDRIASQLPDDIPAPRLRAALQQIRRDINFDQSSGEFNDALNGMRKEFTSQISNALKDAVPEYADTMKAMQARSQNLAKMDRYFGDETKALSSLETLRKGGAKAQLIEDALKSHAGVTGDEGLTQQLEQLRQNQDLLARMKAAEDLRPDLFPKEWNALQEAKAEAQMGADVAAPVERLSQGRTQAVIRNQGGKIPNIEDRRALEALSQAEGKNFPEMISDKNVFDAFKKGQTNGSRMTVLGGTLGGGAGYLIGGAPGAAIGGQIGATTGATLDKYGPAIVKGTVDSANALKEWLSTSEGVQRLGPYARPLLQAASEGNKTLAAVNQTLLRTDPVYRRLFDQQNQDQGDAISRRLNRPSGP